MKTFKWIGIALILLGLVSHPISYAYEEVDVSNGGSISGKIILKGEKPHERVFALLLYPFGSFCKKISDGNGNVKLKEFIVQEDGGLWEAVVAVQKVKKGKPYQPHIAEFVATNCMFHPVDVADNEMFMMDAKGQMHHEHPNVAILDNNQRMNVVNRDPIIHNLQVFQNQKGNIILNAPLPPAKKPKPGVAPIAYRPRGGVIHFKRGRQISQMICGMHEFMQSWGFVVSNPYYAKTAKDGTYTINGLLPGTYKVGIWHPQYPIYEREVTIEANKTTRLDFAFNADLVRRPEYEKQKQFRISPATPEDNKLHEGEERIIID